MGCTTCKSKECRTDARDCFDVKEASLNVYGNPEMKETALAASRLIDNGRAGTLNRIQEVMEYARDRGYKRIGVAYCFGMPHLARSLEMELRREGFQPVMVQCTAGGVREREIDTDKSTETISCNPAGQAQVLMEKGAEFVLEMGLCMGHDVIFHKTLQLPFTTVLVKDRIYQHNPAMALDRYVPSDQKFLEELDDSFRMRSPSWYLEQKELGDDLILLDVRSRESHLQSHIPGSVNIPLKELGSRMNELMANRHHTVVLYCSGGVQAAYAALFLFSRGFSNAYLLSGGISRWTKESLPLAGSAVENPAATVP